MRDEEGKKKKKAGGQLGATSVTKHSRPLRRRRRVGEHLACKSLEQRSSNANVRITSQVTRKENDNPGSRVGPVGGGMSSSSPKSWGNFSFAPAFPPFAERTFWRQQPGERCRKHIPRGEAPPQASESLFTTSCACYFHQNRALSFSPCLVFLRFWQEVVIVKRRLHCVQQRSESLAVHLEETGDETPLDTRAASAPRAHSQSSRGRRVVCVGGGGTGDVLSRQFLS